MQNLLPITKKWLRPFTLLSVASAIVVGCSSASQKSFPPVNAIMPPEVANWPINRQLSGQKDFESIDLFLTRTAKENPGQNVFWWTTYRRAELWAKKNSDVACENFARLAYEPEFPLRRLAFLRAHENCSTNSPLLAKLETFDIDSFDPWLTETAVDVAIKKATDAKDQAKLVALNLRKSKFNLHRDDKVNHTLTALQLANQLGLKDQVNELNRRLYQLSPSYNPSPRRQDYLAVANDFRYRRLFVKSRQFYKKIIDHAASSSAERMQALRGIRMSYKVEQKKPEYVQATRDLASYADKIFRVSKKTEDDYKFLCDHKLILIRTLWTENFLKESEKELVALENTVKNKTSKAEIFWIRGRMSEERGQFDQALQFFLSALEEKQDSKALAEKIRWYLGWNYLKVGKPKEASGVFRELKDKTENTFERTKFSYWLGRSLQKSDEKNDAETEFEEIIKNDPLSYYGYLAYKELDRPLPFQKNKNELPQGTANMSAGLRSLMDERYLEWLIAVQEDMVSRDYLDTISKKLKAHNPDDLESWTTLLSLYAQSGNYLSMFNQLGNMDSPTRRSLFENHPELIFPRPYYDLVRQSSARFGVSIELIYAIMRQESSFNPQARSAMDAFGLMQLLPEVAERSAKENDIPMKTTIDLYEPHVNIAAGAAHLRELWDKNAGEFVLTVASYNASENAIQNWLKTRYAGDTITFIEDIPYDETRDYVKLVLRNMITYQLLLSDYPKPLFPEWALKITYQRGAE